MTGDTTPQDLAIKVLNGKFNCAWGFISVEPITVEDLRHSTPTAKTGPSPLNTRKLTLGEIVDCLADAGLLQGSSLRSSEASALGDDSAVYIRLSHRQVSYTTHHYNESVHVDMDDYDEPVGVEVLGAVSVEVDGIEVSR